VCDSITLFFFFFFFFYFFHWKCIINFLLWCIFMCTILSIFLSWYKFLKFRPISFYSFQNYFSLLYFSWISNLEKVKVHEILFFYSNIYFFMYNSNIYYFFIYFFTLVYFCDLFSITLYFSYVTNTYKYLYNYT